MLLFCLVVPALLSCGGDDRSAQARAEKFVSAYLECRMADARALAVPEMERTLSWRASNLTDEDLALMGAQTQRLATEVEEVSAGDMEAEVRVAATGALLLDSVGRRARMGEAEYEVRLTRAEGGKWLVTAIRRLAD